MTSILDILPLPERKGIDKQEVRLDRNHWISRAVSNLVVAVCSADSEFAAELRADLVDFGGQLVTSEVFAVEGFGADGDAPYLVGVGRCVLGYSVTVQIVGGIYIWPKLIEVSWCT